MTDPQHEYWNGPAADRWIQNREQLDRHIEGIGAAAIALAAPRPGEHVLDVGCGCGTTSIRLHELVSPGGSVTGVDISAPMLEVARRRAPAVTFTVADAATARFPRPFDLVFSRFGVMFFADPPAAFTSLRAALAAGGRLAFCCWRAPAENPWAMKPLAVARDLLPPMDPPDPNAPGPFAFADRARLHGILASAGFATIDISPHDDAMNLGATPDDAATQALTIGPLSRAATGLPDDQRAAIHRRVAGALAEHLTPAGVTLPSAAWLVLAR